jgi:hypothetical protein
LALAVLGCLVFPATTGWAADNREERTFGPDSFDLTGAGKFDVPGFRADIMPFGQQFTNGRDFTILVDSSGKAVGCRPRESGRGSRAFCDATMARGRFTMKSGLDLDFRRGTINLTVRSTSSAEIQRLLVAGSPAPIEPYSFGLDYEIPLKGVAVIFPDRSLPDGIVKIEQQDSRISRGRTWSYPTQALREGIEAEVFVLLTFDEKGRVATCRPQESSNTAWMAYRTCDAATWGISLKGPAREPIDGRNLAWQLKLNWRIP